MSFYFKGREVGTGDIIALRSWLIQPEEVHAVVIDFDQNPRKKMLWVMSTDLMLGNNDEKFAEDDVVWINLICPAQLAVRTETQPKRFNQNQMVSAVVRGVRHQGQVIAALNGVAVVRKSDGSMLRVEASRLATA